MPLENFTPLFPLANTVVPESSRTLNFQKTTLIPTLERHWRNVSITDIKQEAHRDRSHHLETFRM